MNDDHLRPLPDADNWRNQANCHPNNRPDSTTPAEWTDRWFTTIWQDWAATMCNTCPVTDDCGHEGRQRNRHVGRGRQRSLRLPTQTVQMVPSAVRAALVKRGVLLRRMPPQTEEPRLGTGSRRGTKERGMTGHLHHDNTKGRTH